MKPTIEEDPLSPWRLRTESPVAYRAFSYFRDLGPDRSQDLAWKCFCADRGTDSKSARRPTHWAKWSIRFRWVERAEAYDDLIDEENRNAAAARREKRLKKLAEFDEESEQNAQNLVRQADLFVERAFKNPIKGGIVQVKTDEAGTRTTTTVKPTDLRDVVAVWGIRNKTVKQILENPYSKDLEEEEPQAERVFWIKAPKRDPPIQDPPARGPGDRQPIDDLDAEPGDSEDQAA